MGVQFPLISFPLPNVQTYLCTTKLLKTTTFAELPVPFETIEKSSCAQTEQVCQPHLEHEQRGN